jgi:hypothetical protein
VYPDDVRPDGLYRRMRDATHDDAIRAALDAHWNAYQLDYQSLCSRAEALSNAMQEQFASTTATDGFTATRQQIATLMQQRIALNWKVIETAAAMLPREIADGLQNEIQSFSKRIKSARPPLTDPEIHPPPDIQRKLQRQRPQPDR